MNRSPLLKRLFTVEGVGSWGLNERLDEIERLALEPYESPALIRRRRQGRIDPARVAGLVAAYEAGATMRELAAAQGVDPSTISLLLKREHVVSRGRATVIHAQAGKARDLRDQGWSMQRIADHYGCSVTTVWRILHRSGAEPCAGR
ncbi:hypothetical protein JCM10369A_29490 [Nocardioides pyridinolyticus]